MAYFKEKRELTFLSIYSRVCPGKRDGMHSVFIKSEFRSAGVVTEHEENQERDLLSKDRLLSVGSLGGSATSLKRLAP